VTRSLPALFLALAIALSGCNDAASVLSTGAAPETGATVDKPGFNPFSDGPTSIGGGREVIAAPTLADVLQTGELAEMSWGSPTAPVTLIKYASLTCPYCKRFHAETFPLLKREYIDTGKVRFIMREFPIGKTSGSATVALRCAPPDKYLDLYGKFLAQQAMWVSQEVRPEAIFKIAAQVGLRDAEVSACMKDQKLVGQLNAIKERGRKLGIIGTPNFFLDQKLIKSVVTWPDLKAMLDARLAAAPAKTN
jgi:protein-disulfide isomerase